MIIEWLQPTFQSVLFVAVAKHRIITSIASGFVCRRRVFVSGRKGGISFHGTVGDDGKNEVVFASGKKKRINP